MSKCRVAPQLPDEAVPCGMAHPLTAGAVTLTLQGYNRRLRTAEAPVVIGELGVRGLALTTLNAWRVKIGT